VYDGASDPWAALDRAVAPPKAAIARRRLFAGLPIERPDFAQRGLDLSDAEWQRLTQALAELPRTVVKEHHVAADGTVRLVLRLADGASVETVAMPVGAVCVSTQVGCAVGCVFCASGRNGLVRNLEPAEIVEQVVHARREMRIDRVVFMGIGEPTHNLDAVLEAVSRIRADALISPRRQTLSTVGSRNAFARLGAAEVRPCLALSLHSTDDDKRRTLLPRAPREPVAELIAGADDYGRAMGMPVQFEWTLLAGINDGDDELERLAAAMAGRRGYVNFIPWNPVDGARFAPTPRERAVEMVRALRRRSVVATIRSSAGPDAEAACGQLRLRDRA
jgi:23S rRNA (adenine2503-C2)-methyltransferase